MRRRAGRRAAWRGIAVLVIAGSGLLAGCSLLRPEPFEVIAWSPGPGRHDALAGLSVSVTFSQEPDRVSAENAFSLTKDGARVPGTFAWDGRTLRFEPYYSLQENHEFHITVASDARTPDGLSLERDFEERFSTKPEDDRPVVLSTVPERGAVVDDDYAAVSLLFSEAVDAETYREHLSISPSIRGVWGLEEGGALVRFHPLEPWEWGEEYEVTVSSSLGDASGNLLGEEYSFTFSVGADTTPPNIADVEALDGEGNPVRAILADVPADGVYTENAGWEAVWRVRFSFSEPVRLYTLASRIVCEDGPSLELETTGEVSDAAVFRFSERPAWNIQFALRVRSGVEDQYGNRTEDEYVYRLVSDGPLSRPPRLVGIRIPLAPGAAAPEDRELAVFDADYPYADFALLGDAERYPYGVATATSVELYFEVAPGAALDRMSVMDAFGVSATNEAMDFSASSVALGGVDYAPAYEPWEAYAVARVDGRLTNRVDSGVVTFTVASGLKDSGGNATSAAQSLPLNK